MGGSYKSEAWFKAALDENKSPGEVLEAAGDLLDDLRREGLSAKDALHVVAEATLAIPVANIDAVDPNGLVQGAVRQLRLQQAMQKAVAGRPTRVTQAYLFEGEGEKLLAQLARSSPVGRQKLGGVILTVAQSAVEVFYEDVGWVSVRSLLAVEQP